MRVQMQSLSDVCFLPWSKGREALVPAKKGGAIPYNAGIGSQVMLVDKFNK